MLLTGQPACGKTTVVCRVIEQLGDLRLAGFYTQEIRRGGNRLGFEAIGLGSGRVVLAHVMFRTEVRVGRYGVELGGFEELVRAELGKSADSVDLFVVDEIGKMECASARFVEAARGVLDGPVPVLATVGYKGRGFMVEVKTRPDIRLITVSAENRQRLPQQLADRLRGLVRRRPAAG